MEKISLLQEAHQIALSLLLSQRAWLRLVMNGSQAPFPGLVWHMGHRYKKSQIQTEIEDGLPAERAEIQGLIDLPLLTSALSPTTLGQVLYTILFASRS